MCYNPNNDRLYWSTGAFAGTVPTITVFDCTGDTIVKRIPTIGGVQACQLYPGLNKLYAQAFDETLGRDAINVIDCDHDSVTSRIILHDDVLKKLFLVPEDNRLWYLGVHYVIAMDCVGDSIVADALDSLGSIDDACVCREDRKIYAGWFGRPAWIIDMDDPAHVDTLHEIIHDVGMRFLDMPGARKAYWCVNYSGHSPGNSRIFVIDTRTSTITDSFWAGRQISGLCLDHTGRYVYCTGYEVNALLVIDTQTDSVLTMFDLPSSTFGPPLLNRVTNRVYPSGSGNPIPVVRDSMLIGLEELKSVVRPTCINPTLISRSVPLRATTPAELYDASGRKAATLRKGLNDISRLAPGVYFVREEPQPASSKPQAVRKVVVAR